LFGDDSGACASTLSERHHACQLFFCHEILSLRGKESHSASAGIADRKNRRENVLY
jgi:hypothetical protein